jgi:hypothetical protein
LKGARKILAPLVKRGWGDSSFIYKPLKATQFKPYGKNEQGGVLSLFF